VFLRQGDHPADPTIPPADTDETFAKPAHDKTLNFYVLKLNLPPLLTLLTRLFINQ
jgi:hypothetical protein